MQEDLENFAKEMQKLEPKDRLYWLRSLAHCRATATPSTYPMYKTLNQIETHFLRFKSTLIWTLSSRLTSGKEKKTPVVKKGIDAFMSVSKKEKNFIKWFNRKCPAKLPQKLLMFHLSL